MLDEHPVIVKRGGHISLLAIDRAGGCGERRRLVRVGAVGESRREGVATSLANRQKAGSSPNNVEFEFSYHDVPTFNEHS